MGCLPGIFLAAYASGSDSSYALGDEGGLLGRAEMPAPLFRLSGYFTDTMFKVGYFTNIFYNKYIARLRFI